MPISAPPLPISWEIVRIAMASSCPAALGSKGAGRTRSDGGGSIVLARDGVKPRPASQNPGLGGAYGGGSPALRMGWNADARLGARWIPANSDSHPSSRWQRFERRHMALRIRNTNLVGIAIRGKQDIPADGRGGHRGRHLPHLGRGRYVLAHVLEHQLPPASGHDDLIGGRPVEHHDRRLEPAFLTVEAGRDRGDDTENQAVLVAILDDEAAQHETVLCASKPMVLRERAPVLPFLRGDSPHCSLQSQEPPPARRRPPTKHTQRPPISLPTRGPTYPYRHEKTSEHPDPGRHGQRIDGLPPRIRDDPVRPILDAIANRARGLTERSLKSVAAPRELRADAPASLPTTAGRAGDVTDLVRPG